MGHGLIGPEHLLLGLVRGNKEIASEFRAIGLPLERLRTLAKRQLNQEPESSLPVYSTALRQLLKDLPETAPVTPKDLLKRLLEDKSAWCYTLIASTGELSMVHHWLFSDDS